MVTLPECAAADAALVETLVAKRDVLRPNKLRSRNSRRMGGDGPERQSSGDGELGAPAAF